MMMMEKGGKLEQAVKGREKEEKINRKNIDQSLKEEPKNKILLKFINDLRFIIRDGVNSSSYGSTWWVLSIQ
jgi:hypothetical protein